MTDKIEEFKSELMYKEKGAGFGFVLFFLFGPFGVHRFYFKKHLTGILFVILFWSLIISSGMLFYDDSDVSFKIFSFIGALSIIEFILIPFHAMAYNKKIKNKRKKYIEGNK